MLGKLAYLNGDASKKAGEETRGRNQQVVGQGKEREKLKTDEFIQV